MIRLVVQVDGRDLTFAKKDGKLEGALDLAVVAIDGQNGKSKGGTHFSLTMPVQEATRQQVVGDRRPGHDPARSAAGTLPVADRRGRHRQPARRLGALRPRRARLHGRPADDERRRSDVGAGGAGARRPPRARTTSSARRCRGRRPSRASSAWARNWRSWPRSTTTTRRRRTRWTSRRHCGPTMGAWCTRTRTSGRARNSAGSIGGYGHQARIPLKGMAPGLYVLKVEARTRLGKGFAASREVQFQDRAVGASDRRLLGHFRLELRDDLRLDVAVLVRELELVAAPCSPWSAS